MDQVTHTLVVPHVTAGSDEQCLTRRHRIETNAALGAVDAGGVRVTALVDARALEQAFVCGCVEIVEALLPAAVAFDTDLDAAENHLLATLEIDSELNHITIIYGVWSALNTGTRQTDVVEESARTGFDVLDVPLTAGTPELAVATRDDFRFEADG